VGDAAAVTSSSSVAADSAGKLASPAVVTSSRLSSGTATPSDFGSPMPSDPSLSAEQAQAHRRRRSVRPLSLQASDEKEMKQLQQNIENMAEKVDVDGNTRSWLRSLRPEDDKSAEPHGASTVAPVASDFHDHRNSVNVTLVAMAAAAKTAQDQQLASAVSGADSSASGAGASQAPPAGVMRAGSTLRTDPSDLSALRDGIAARAAAIASSSLNLDEPSLPRPVSSHEK